MTSTAPAPSSSRPALPIFRLNPHLATIPTDNLVVKYQTIVREGNEIIVGRVKVPTPEGHAFVLRRYDTGAFSLTTMFKATFPGASNEEEKIECEWVKSTYDNSGANGGKFSSDVRLAGSWIVAGIATLIAKDYGLEQPVASLASASPDPGVQYRKSQRSQAAAAMETNTSKKARTEEVSHGSVPLQPTLAEPVDPRILLDIQAGKDLVALVRKSIADDKADVLLQAAKEQVKKGGAAVGEVKKAAKRALEEEEEEEEEKEEEEKKDVKEDEGVLEEGRAIASNRRVEVPVGRTMQTVKQAAWGAFVFGVGIGATTILPRFFF